MFERKRHYAWLILTVLSLTACGGPDITTLCEEQEACVGGNEADIDACIASYEGFLELASDIGCSDEVDALFACQEGRLSCREVPAGGGMCATDADCDNQGNNPERCSGGQCVRKIYGYDPQASEDPCEAESNAYGRCF